MTLRSIALSLLLLSTMSLRIMTLSKMKLTIVSKPNDIQHKILRLATLSITTYYSTCHNNNKCSTLSIMTLDRVTLMRASL